VDLTQIETKDLGTHYVKGIKEGITIYQLSTTPYRTFQPLRTDKEESSQLE